MTDDITANLPAGWLQKVTQPRPIHMHIMAVMSDGGVLSLELPTEPQDEAEFAWSLESNFDDPVTGERAAEEVTRTVEFTAEVLYRGQLDRDGGLYRVGTFGGADTGAEIPGKQVPDYVVAMLAKLLSGWSPAGHAGEPGSQAYAHTVRAQATMTGQWMWEQAYFAGMHAGAQMAFSQPQRMMLGPGKVAPMKMPLFNGEGQPRWMPDFCTYDRETGNCTGCAEAVETIEAPLDGLSEGGRRQVVLRPCGHRVWVPDPVIVSFE